MTAAPQQRGGGTPPRATPDGGGAPEVLVDGLGFPEGPRWHDGSLWFSDFTQRTLYRLASSGAPEVVIRLDDSPSGLGFLPDGSALVVSMHARQLLRLTDDGPTLHADLSEIGGDFLNDMVVDGLGNAYVGTRTRAMRPSRSALGPEWEVDTIVMVAPDGRAHVAADHLIAPNGTVIAPDGSYLVVAETYGQRLTTFDRAADGSLSNRRVFADVPGAYPDGICLDEEGAIWFGSPYTNEFLRVRDSGEITDRVSLPGGVACMLGGPDRRTLHLLGVDPAQLPVPGDVTAPPALPTEGASAAGHIWTMRVARGGAGWP